MDEIKKAENNEPTIAENNTAPNPGKFLSIDHTTPNIDFKGVLHNLLQFADMKNTVSHIKKGMEYVVQIPEEFQKGLELGEFSIMQNQKTGTKWPSLITIGEDGKRKIATPLPIKEQEFIQGSPFKDLTQNCHNLHIQSQLKDLDQKLEEAIDLTKKVLQGQKDDRIGTLNAGRNQILLALNQKDDSSRTTAFQLGISHLCLAQGQFEQSLITMAKEFKPVPKTKIGILAQSFFKSSYCYNKDKEYEDIEEAFELYMLATQYIAATYIVMGDEDNSAFFYDNIIERVKNIDFSNIKTIANIHKGERINWLFDNIEGYLKYDKKVCLENAKHYDGIEIKVTGDMLLEAIDDDRRKEI